MLLKGKGERERGKGKGKGKGKGERERGKGKAVVSSGVTLHERKLLSVTPTILLPLGGSR